MGSIDYILELICSHGVFAGFCSQYQWINWYPLILANIHWLKLIIACKHMQTMSQSVFAVYQSQFIPKKKWWFGGWDSCQVDGFFLWINHLMPPSTAVAAAGGCRCGLHCGTSLDTTWGARETWLGSGKPWGPLLSVTIKWDDLEINGNVRLLTWRYCRIL